MEARGEQQALVCSYIQTALLESAHRIRYTSLTSILLLVISKVILLVSIAMAVVVIQRVLIVLVLVLTILPMLLLL